MINITISTFNLYIGGSLTLYSNIESMIKKNDLNHLTFSNKKYFSVQRKTLFLKYPICIFNPIYRFCIEQFLLPLFALLNGSKGLIMMGNFPSLIWPYSQNVLVHNTLYLQKTKFSFKLTFEKLIFNIFIRIKKPKILVQTKHVEQLFISKFGDSYKVRVIGFPVEKISYKRRRLNNQKQILLFYPAINYPHKNHQLLFKISDWLIENDFKIYLTINYLETSIASDTNFNAKPFVFTGSLDKIQINNIYDIVDGLIFPSQTESLGIPLIEAASLLLPIMAPNLEYTQSVVSDFYNFEVDNIDSLKSALKNFKIDLLNNKTKIPKLKILTHPEKFFQDLINYE